jgi:L-cysteine/cystine lyase
MTPPPASAASPATPEGFAELRAQIPVLARTAYLNAGTFGPLHQATVAAQQEVQARELHEGRSSAAMWQDMAAVRSRLRTGIGAVMGVPAEHLALTTSTGQGCNIVFAGLGLQPEDEVVTSDLEHFGMVGPLHAARVRVTVVPLADKPAADAFELLRAAVTPRTKLLALSHVAWSTGQVLPLPELREATGIPILVDGAQSAGAIDIAGSAAGLDFYTASAQKWLCGPDQLGALYVRDPERLRVALPSYRSTVTYEPDGTFVPQAGAARFEQASGPLSGLAGLDVALGTHPAWRYSRALEMAARCRDLLLAAGENVVTEPGQGTLVTWVARGDSAALVERAHAQGVVIRDLPGTGWARASCGWWTSEDDLQRLVAAIA